ncbi:hypothetical protein [Microbispora sp. NPDC049125]|uniref:hypothetical protein n=1 Tax=Microbispora sp. NPDC049125 TaxID=3154929 RepID=UPI0034655F7E
MENLKSQLIRTAGSALDKLGGACSEAAAVLRALEIEDEEGKSEAPKSGDDLEHKTRS